MTCAGSLPMASAMLPESVRLSPKKKTWLNCADAVVVAPAKKQVATNERTKPSRRTMGSPPVALAGVQARERRPVLRRCKRVYGESLRASARRPAAIPLSRGCSAPTAGDEADRAESADQERERRRFGHRCRRHRRGDVAVDGRARARQERRRVDR